MIQKIELLLNSEGLRQSLTTIIGNFMATGISARSMILISRILGPEKFGEFSIGFALALVLNKFNDFGLNAAIHKFASNNSDKTSINRVFSWTLKTKLFFSIIILVVGIALSSWIAELLHFEKTSIIFGAFFFQIGSVVYEQLITMLQSLHRFSQAVYINLIQAVTKLIMISLLFLSSITDAGIIFMVYTLAPLTPAFFLRWLFPSWTKIKLKDNFEHEKKTIIPMMKHSSIAFISAGIIENLDIFFLQKYLNTYETGLYSGVSKIALMVILIAYSLSHVLNPRVARYRKKSDLSIYLRKAFLVSIAALFGIVAFFPFAKPAIWLTVGPQYLGGTGVLIILMASSFFTIAAIPFMALFYSFDAPWYFSTSGILQLSIMIIGNILFVPLFGLDAAAWTRFVTRLALLLFTVCFSIILYRKKYRQQSLNK